MPPAFVAVLRLVLRLVGKMSGAFSGLRALRLGSEQLRGRLSQELGRLRAGLSQVLALGQLGAGLSEDLQRLQRWTI